MVKGLGGGRSVGASTLEIEWDQLSAGTRVFLKKEGIAVQALLMLEHTLDTGKAMCHCACRVTRPTPSSAMSAAALTAEVVSWGRSLPRVR